MLYLLCEWFRKHFPKDKTNIFHEQQDFATWEIISVFHLDKRNSHCLMSSAWIHISLALIYSVGGYIMDWE